MAKNLVPKAWVLQTAWDGRRYSDPDKVPSEGDGVAWAPNLPSGLTVLVDRQWDPTDSAISGGVLPPAGLSGTDEYGMTWYPMEGHPPLIGTPAELSAVIGSDVPSIPDGHPTCMAIRYPAGLGSGTTPFGISLDSVGVHRRMYHCAWVLMPPGFDSAGNHIKWVFNAQNGSRNHVWMLSSNGAGSYIGPWMATQGGGGSYYLGGAASSMPDAIVCATLPVRDADGYWDYRQGRWCCIEWLSEMESVPGASDDGVFQAWFNGTLINHFDNVRYNTDGDPDGFDTVWFAPYYGGGGSAAPSDQYLLLGRFFVAAGE